MKVMWLGNLLIPMIVLLRDKNSWGQSNPVVLMPSTEIAFFAVLSSKTLETEGMLKN